MGADEEFDKIDRIDRNRKVKERNREWTRMDMNSIGAASLLSVDGDTV